MNNFRNFSRKYDRSVLERTVLSKLRSAYPNLEHSIAAHRFPTLPKIILYSSAANSEESLKNIFPFYNVITPTPTAETDEIITRRIAEKLIQIEETNENEGNRFGYILKGFPFNTFQAQLLDRYINGVNLALHLRSATESADYVSSMNPLITYYRERGALLELPYNSNPTLEETENTFDQIKINIKRSF